ncbi:MAG: hypothetical protein QW701_02990 [Candidatus Nezhaarchaeales archaeon]
MDSGKTTPGNLRSRLRSALLEMQTDVNRVDDAIQGFEKKLEDIVCRLEQLEERLKKIEKALSERGVVKPW